MTCKCSSSSVALGVIVLVGCALAQPYAVHPVLQYSSYLGGSVWDSVSAVVVGANGYLYVAGTTRSYDFPTTPGAYQTRYGGDSGSGNYSTGDAFVSKIDPKQ